MRRPLLVALTPLLVLAIGGCVESASDTPAITPSASAAPTKAPADVIADALAASVTGPAHLNGFYSLPGVDRINVQADLGGSETRYRFMIGTTDINEFRLIGDTLFEKVGEGSWHRIRLSKLTDLGKSVAAMVPTLRALGGITAAEATDKATDFTGTLEIAEARTATTDPVARRSLQEWAKHLGPTCVFQVVLDKGRISEFDCVPGAGTMVSFGVTYGGDNLVGDVKVA